MVLDRRPWKATKVNNAKAICVNEHLTLEFHMHDKRKPRLALVLDLPGLIMDDPSHGTGAQLKQLAQQEINY